MPTWSLEWIFFPCLFPACLSPDGHQISLLSHGTVVWGKEAHFKKLLVKKEKFDFSLPSLFFPRGAACCSCLCYPQEGTFLKANWNSAQTQSRPKDLVDSLDFTEGRFWQEIDFWWKQIPHQGSGILWNLVFIHEKYRCFGRWKGNLKWNYSFELFPEWKNSQRVKTESNKKIAFGIFAWRKILLVLNGRIPIPVQVPTHFPTWEISVSASPHPWRRFPALMILGFWDSLHAVFYCRVQNIWSLSWCLSMSPVPQDHQHHPMQVLRIISSVSVDFPFNTPAIKWNFNIISFWISSSCGAHGRGPGFAGRESLKGFT